MPPKGYKTLTLPETTYDLLTKLAEKTGKTLAELELFLIENYEEEHATMCVQPEPSIT